MQTETHSTVEDDSLTW